MKIFVSFIIMLSICSCQPKTEKIKLKGKIAMEAHERYKYKVYSDIDTLEFYLKDTDSVEYSISTWLNTTDAFFCIECFKTDNYYQAVKSNLISIDLNGNFIKKYFSLKDGFRYYGGYTSKNDSFLLYTTFHDNKFRPVKFFSEPLSIILIELNTTKVIKQFDNICPRINFDFSESPWSPDGKRFVYSIFEGYMINIEKGRKPGSTSMPPLGIYIYSIPDDKLTRITTNGYHAIWSPKGDYIAYLLGEELWLYNVNDHSNSLFYRPKLYERLADIHWTPDGEYIFAICPKNYFNMKIFYSYNEKLFSLSKRKPVDFHKLNKGFTWYSWKE